MIRLRSLMPRGRKLFYLVLLVPAGLLLLFFFGSFFKIDLVVDPAAILWAVAVTLAIGVVFLFVQHLLKPKQTLSVGFHVKLDQPSMPLVGRYAFRLQIFYELEEKGERSRIDQGTIEMRFKKRDHPEILTWCCSQIAEHLGKHAEFAAEQYPRARILLPPQPTPNLLASEVGGPESELPRRTGANS